MKMLSFSPKIISVWLALEKQPYIIDVESKTAFQVLFHGQTSPKYLKIPCFDRFCFFPKNVLMTIVDGYCRDEQDVFILRLETSFQWSCCLNDGRCQVVSRKGTLLTTGHSTNFVLYIEVTTVSWQPGEIDDDRPLCVGGFGMLSASSVYLVTFGCLMVNFRCLMQVVEESNLSYLIINHHRKHNLLHRKPINL